jgi:hypothetical protein
VGVSQLIARIIILLIFLGCEIYLLSSIYLAYTKSHFQQPLFWGPFLFFVLMGYYWVELLAFFQSNKALAYLFAILLLLSYHLTRAGNPFIFGDYLYLAAISPGVGLARHVIIEYKERKKRKTIFSN